MFLFSYKAVKMKFTHSVWWIIHSRTHYPIFGSMASNGSLILIEEGPNQIFSCNRFLWQSSVTSSGKALLHAWLLSEHAPAPFPSSPVKTCNLKVLVPILSGYFLPLRDCSYLLYPPPPPQGSVWAANSLSVGLRRRNIISSLKVAPRSTRGKWGCVRTKISKPWLAKTGWTHGCSAYPCRIIRMTHNMIIATVIFHFWVT